MARSAKPKQDFEAALAELDSIVASMESGQVSLDEALGQFQRGSELIRECQTTLSAAESRLSELDAMMNMEVASAAETDSDAHE